MNLNEEQLEKTQKIIADDNFVYMGDSFFIMDVVNAIKAGYRLNRLDEETEETKEAKRQGAKFATRDEQRKVTETIDAIILPLLPHLKKDEADAVQTAIAILKEVEVESGVEMAIKESVLDKIRAEIESQREEASNKHSEDEGLTNYYFGLNDGLKDARDILDKYKYRK